LLQAHCLLVRTNALWRIAKARTEEPVEVRNVGEASRSWTGAFILGVRTATHFIKSSGKKLARNRRSPDNLSRLRRAASIAPRQVRREVLSAADISI
jgi:hypothetical protein